MENPNNYNVGFVKDDKIVEFDSSTGQHKWTSLGHKPSVKKDEASPKPDSK